MKLGNVKGCIESEILARLGYPDRNLELCSEKVAELENEIENDIKRYGDVDAGLLCCAGVEMRYMTHHCANQMMCEMHDKYQTDLELVEAIDTVRRNADGHLIMSGNELAAALMAFGVSGFIVMWILGIPIFGR